MNAKQKKPNILVIWRRRHRLAERPRRTLIESAWRASHSPITTHNHPAPPVVPHSSLASTQFAPA